MEVALLSLLAGLAAGLIVLDLKVLHTLEALQFPSQVVTPDISRADQTAILARLQGRLDEATLEPSLPKRRALVGDAVSRSLAELETAYNDVLFNLPGMS